MVVGMVEMADEVELKMLTTAWIILLDSLWAARWAGSRASLACTSTR